MILITGGTGTSGTPIVEAVARTGHPFRVMARTPAKVAAAVERLGGEVVQGDFADPASLERCCAGADRVLLNSGPTEDLLTLQTSVIDAARRAGVPHVVKFSVGGIGQAEPHVRFVKQHAEVETALKASGLAWTMLRPTFFMQNLLGSAATIRDQGAIYQPAGDGRAPYIDVRDIADVAAIALTGPGHEGQVYTLTGPEDVSFHDMAKSIGAATGKPVQYVPVEEAAARQSLLGAGIPPWNVEGMLELMRALRAGWMAGPTDDVARLTGRPARTFAAFARDHAAAFANP